MLTDPASYRIRVKGQLGPEWCEWFGGMTITYDKPNETILFGQIVDQAGLHMNTNVSNSETARNAFPDRVALRARLEETRLAFHTVIESLTDVEWESKLTSTRWTVRELMSHIADGLAHTPDAIEHVRRGKQFLNLPHFLDWLTALINLLMSKRSARGLTHQTVLARYDAAHQALLHTMESIRDDEWSRGAQCYGDGYKTVLDLCVGPNRHLQEHTAQLLKS